MEDFACYGRFAFHSIVCPDYATGTFTNLFTTMRCLEPATFQSGVRTVGLAR